MASSYTASDIEVLSGLDPVRRRPGMYTDTTRPNHLAHEVVDNSVDEALAGYCDRIDVTLFKDGSCQVEDNGRGMPVDIHPKEKISGVELILTRLHAGGKFNDKTYQHAGGLHGVGVSVVNALSKNLEVLGAPRRQGIQPQLRGRQDRASKLEVVDEVPKSKTGTRLRFWPDPKYFDTDKFAVASLKQVLRAKAVLCPNLQRVPHQRNHRRARPVDLHRRPARIPRRSSSARANGCRRTPSTESATSRAARSNGPSPGFSTASGA